MWIELRQEFNEQIKASELPIRTAVGKTIRLLQTLEDVSQLWKRGALKAPNLALVAPSETGFGRTTPLTTLWKKDETRLIAEKAGFFS